MFFTGGLLGQAATSDLVDIYDTVTGSWCTANLSMARHDVTAAATGGKVVFGGGYTNGNVTNRVDIYDVAASTWTIATLSTARSGCGAASAGSKVLFGGGWTSWPVYPDGMARVDIYDAATNSWSTERLSLDRFDLAAASVGGKILFGGGNRNGAATDMVDIYDSTSGLWSTTALSQARMRLAATSAEGKVFFAGGWGSYPDYTPSNVVDIYDAASASWSTATLSRARTSLAATSVGNKVFFAGGVAEYSDTGSYSDVVDIYTFQNYSTITSSTVFTLVNQTTVEGRMQLNAGASLNLDGYNLTVGSMGGVAPIDLSTHTLTTGGDNTDSRYNGTIGGSGGLFKTGSGVLAVSGNNSYLGLTTVSGGELDLVGPNAWNPITNLGGAYLSGGELVFDYTGSADPYATIQSLLLKKINGSMPLNVTDDIVIDRVTVSLVPEPSSLLLVATCLLSLLGCAWRWRKHRA